jgi:hypothetical protein
VKLKKKFVEVTRISGTSFKIWMSALELWKTKNADVAFGLVDYKRMKRGAKQERRGLSEAV